LAAAPTIIGGRGALSANGSEVVLGMKTARWGAKNSFLLF
jgi:hypothetical protein